MSPSLPSNRPVWVWSLPAFAILLSFLWYRKKRGSLKTDSGGAVETSAEIEKLIEEIGDSNEIAEISDQEINSAGDDAEDRAEVIEIVEKVQVEEVPVIPEEVKEEVKGEIQEGEEAEKVSEQMVVATAAALPVAAAAEIPEDKPQVDTPKPIKNKCKKKKHKEMANKITNDSSLDKRQHSSNEESTAVILEQKLAKLDLANQCSSDGGDEKQANEDEAERDSANNSPSEVMLASPSVSGYSDTHSEGSSDSGKGCSEMLTPSRTPASGNSVSGDIPATSIYEFVIPQQLVGRLIGRHGSYIQEIKQSTHSSIYIKRHPETTKLKICAVEGTQMDIESALDMIRRKFPKKRYPNVTLEQVVIAPEPQIIPVLPENMQLYLVEGINNDVILSSLVSAGHFFLQQPTHPTYLSLNRLNSCMALCYSEPNSPTIPEGISAGVLCAAPVHSGWYRAQIISLDTTNDVCDIKFVDYGGYMSLPISLLRQIRADFINLPFQAAECYLANVKPAGDTDVWSEEAKESVEKLTFGKVLQAQVYGYADDGVPLIYLYTVFNNEVILLNQELVDRGHAEWLYSEPVTEEVQLQQEEAVECPEVEATEELAIAV